MFPINLNVIFILHKHQIQIIINMKIFIIKIKNTNGSILHLDTFLERISNMSNMNTS